MSRRNAITIRTLPAGQTVTTVTMGCALHAGQWLTSLQFMAKGKESYKITLS